MHVTDIDAHFGIGQEWWSKCLNGVTGVKGPCVPALDAHPHLMQKNEPIYSSSDCAVLVGDHNVAGYALSTRARASLTL